MVKRNFIGKRIKKLRKDRKLTQSELAEAAGYSDKSGIARVESGENIPGMDRLEMIAQALNVAPEYLTEENRPELRNFIEYVNDENFGSTLNDSHLSKLNYLVKHPDLLDFNLVDGFRELMITSGSITCSDGESAVIRYGRSDAPLNEEEYSAYKIVNGVLEKEPSIIFKAYVNYFEPALMLRRMLITPDSDAISKGVMNRLIDASNRLGLQEIRVRENCLEEAGRSIEREESTSFFESFDYKKVKLVVE